MSVFISYRRKSLGNHNKGAFSDTPYSEVFTLCIIFMILTEKSNFWKFSLFLVYFDEKFADEEMSGDHGRCIGELEMQK